MEYADDDSVRHGYSFLDARYHVCSCDRMRVVFLTDFMIQPTAIQDNAERIALAIEAARSVRKHAYAPYSNFLVGACLVTNNGTMHVGCNVENASYGLTQCAERAAVTAATAAGMRDIVLCVIVTATKQPTAPCGACRQVLHECNPSMLVISCTEAGVEQRWWLHDLLPSSFDSSSIEEMQ